MFIDFFYWIVHLRGHIIRDTINICCHIFHEFTCIRIARVLSYVKYESQQKYAHTVHFFLYLLLHYVLFSLILMYSYLWIFKIPESFQEKSYLICNLNDLRNHLNYYYFFFIFVSFLSYSRVKEVPNMAKQYAVVIFFNIQHIYIRTPGYPNILQLCEYIIYGIKYLLVTLVFRFSVTYVIS